MYTDEIYGDGTQETRQMHKYGERANDQNN